MNGEPHRNVISQLKGSAVFSDIFQPRHAWLETDLEPAVQVRRFCEWMPSQQLQYRSYKDKCETLWCYLFIYFL